MTGRVTRIELLGLRLPSISSTAIYPILDWFIPTKIREDKQAHQRARMFLISHLFGPILGNTITVYLLWLDPIPRYELAVLAGVITGFGFFRSYCDGRDGTTRSQSFRCRI